MASAPSSSTPFRIQGRNFLLTWPQSSFNIDDCLVFLRNKSNNITRVIVCSETHATETLHRHAFVQYSRRTDIRNARFFDFDGRHPRIEIANNIPATINYVKKDGIFVEWQSDETPTPTSIFNQARELSFEEFYQYALDQKIPFGYADMAYKHVNSESDLITFTEDPNADLNLPFGRELSEYNLSTNLTNVIVGPSGCGKTTYALRMATKPTLFLTHLDQLKHLTSGIRSIIMDDMNFSHLPVTSQIHLVDRVLPRAIHRRYGTTLIPAGTQVIMTCNERPVLWTPAIARRLNYLLIN